MSEMNHKILNLINCTALLVLLVNVSSGWGQDSLITFNQTDSSLAFIVWEIKIDSTTQDSLDKVCDERGHVLNGMVGVTLIGWAPTFIDLPDRTLLISHDPNYMSGTCMRCRRYVSQPVQAEPDTSILWIREEKK